MRLVLVGVLGGALLGAPLSFSAQAQSQAQAQAQDDSPAAAAVPHAPAQTAAVRLNGIWELNKDLSTAPMAAPGARAGGGSSDQGGRGGGSRRGGNGSAGVGWSGGGRGFPDREDGRLLLQELGQSPAQLVIVSKDNVLSVTDSDGVVRHFTINDKTETLALGGKTVDVKSAWKNDTIDQQFKLGDTRVERMIDSTTDGHQLVISIVQKADRDNPVPPIRFVYNRSVQ